MPCSEGRGGRCWRAGSPGQGPPPGEAGRPDSSGTTPHPHPASSPPCPPRGASPRAVADPAEHRADASLEPSSMLPLYRWENRSHGD